MVFTNFSLSITHSKIRTHTKQTTACNLQNTKVTIVDFKVNLINNLRPNPKACSSHGFIYNKQTTVDELCDTFIQLYKTRFLQ